MAQPILFKSGQSRSDHVISSFPDDANTSPNISLELVASALGVLMLVAMVSTQSLTSALGVLVAMVSAQSLTSALCGVLMLVAMVSAQSITSALCGVFMIVAMVSPQLIGSSSEAIMISSARQ